VRPGQPATVCNDLPSHASQRLRPCPTELSSRHPSIR
jgi:hypothetical protein